MKSKICRIIILAIITSTLFACKKDIVKENLEKNEVERKINVIATTFPIYDITKEIIKEVSDVDIRLLMDAGIDLHNFSPSSKDLVDITNCDLFIYIGGESDEWVDEAFNSLNISKEKQLNLMSSINSNLKEEELKEGMEDTEEETDGEVEGEAEYDEHIWLSVKNAKVIAENIKNRVRSLVKEDDKEKIENNYKTYISELDVLDKSFAKCISDAKENKKETTMIFADRFPFRYFVDDYDIDYFAAFKGCSAESEASFKTIVFLADKLKELNVKNLFVIDGSDKKIAKTVIETSGLNDIQILELDSMQSKTAKDVSDGESYIKIMKKNLSVLEKYYK